MEHKILKFKTLNSYSERKEFRLTNKMKEDLSQLARICDCSESDVIRYSLNKTIKEANL